MTAKVPARGPVSHSSSGTQVAPWFTGHHTGQGAKPLQLALSVGIGLAVRFLLPRPLGLVLEPLPVGAWAFLAATTAVATRTLSFAQAFSAFTDDAIWLIVVAFFFARGFEKTGLGERVANMFVKLFGKSTLGLAYGLAIAEALIAPAMPSTTARAGGIFMPIISSLSKSAGSKPNDESRRKLGAFLVLSQFEGTANSSNMYLTAAAQNLLCIKIAASMGLTIPAAWVTWFKVAIAPAWAGLLVTPLLLYKLFPPQVKATPEAPKLASERLQKMGPMSRDEMIMVATMAAAVTLWVLGERLGVPAVVTAMMGLSALLLLGVLQWRDCLQYATAWDTLFWFAVLVGMSNQLNAIGVINHFASSVGSQLVAARLDWLAVFAILNVAYFVLHYMFAAQTAHVGALFPAFVTMMLTAGVPPPIACLSLGYMTNLFGAITHFGSGQAAVYYGSGYLTLKEVFSYGALMAVVNLLLWGVVGGAWWRFLGFL
ncbi:hypothetical protein N2152v2_002940 [Parachlorella kessleri]